MSDPEVPLPATAGADVGVARDLAARQHTDTNSALQELAEDMLDVIQRLNRMQQLQTEALGRLADVDQGARAFASSTAWTLDVLRRDLLGERKALAFRKVVDAVAPALDSLRTMNRGLELDTDDRMIAQLQGVIAILENVLQTLGFVAFSPAVGERFDPERMESAGHGEGPFGTVVELIHCGYSDQQIVVRPASVLIGSTAGSDANEPHEKRKTS